jgi:hypothetical protein
MLRANRYKVLSGLADDESAVTGSGGKVVLIEELPSFAARKKEDFHDILFQVCNTSPGVDVMTTNFCDFRSFSAEKMAFFFKSQCNYPILFSFVLSQKRHFGRKYF